MTGLTPGLLAEVLHCYHRGMAKTLFLCFFLHSSDHAELTLAEDNTIPWLIRPSHWTEMFKHPVPRKAPRRLPRHPKRSGENHPRDKCSYSKSTSGFLAQTLPGLCLLFSKSLLLPVAETLTQILEAYLPGFNRTETP